MTGAGPTTDELAGTEVICLRCGYNLRGLDPGGVCPECGMPIERSLHSNLLRFSDDRYLATLHRGVFLVLASLAGQHVLLIGTVFVAFALAWLGLRVHDEVIGVSSVIATGLAITTLVGWWMFSAPDPAGTDRANVARRIVRWTLLAAVALTILFALAASRIFFGGLTGTSVGLALTVGIALVLTILVTIVASMLYVRWLAPRLPNAKADRRAKLLIWLGPVLLIGGTPACYLGPVVTLVGPLVTLVLYWNLLEWIRKDLKRIRSGLGDGATAKRADMARIGEG